jgi:ActR/RegA family two-component response regulator
MAARDSRFDVAFLDVRLGDTSGLDLIAPVLATHDDLAIFVITAYAAMDASGPRRLAREAGAQTR